MRSQWIQWDQGSASRGPDSKPSDGSASPTQCRAPTSPPARNTSHWGMLRGCLGNHPNLWLTLGDLHLGICFFLFIGYIPHMVVNISSDLRPDLLVVWSQVAEMSQAAARREPGCPAGHIGAHRLAMLAGKHSTFFGTCAIQFSGLLFFPGLQVAIQGFQQGCRTS